MPGGIRGVFSGCLCTVKLSKDPFSEIRESIIETVRDVGAVGWDDVEELVYCYIALNSPDLYPLIEAAFLSMFGISPSPTKQSS